MFFATTSGPYTESALPFLNLLDVLTVNNIYRLHALKFTYLWHKGLLPSLFDNLFQSASYRHTHNTRYASKQNFCKPRPRTNTGKQMFSYQAIDLWRDIPYSLKDLSTFSFAKEKLQKFLWLGGLQSPSPPRLVRLCLLGRMSWLVVVTKNIVSLESCLLHFIQDWTENILYPVFLETQVKVGIGGTGKYRAIRAIGECSYSFYEFSQILMNIFIAWIQRKCLILP